MISRMDKMNQTLEKLEKIIDNGQVDDEVKDEIREIINIIDDLFYSMKYDIDNLEDEIEMMKDNMVERSYEMDV